MFGSSTTSTLPPRILALYVHNGVKITAKWLSGLYESWDESAVEQIRSITSALESQLAQCAGSPDVELQERAAELGGLLQLVRQGLDRPRAFVESEASDSGQGDVDVEATSPSGFVTSSRQPPDSLQLLEPMFFSHELNPVNPKAQSLVVPPEGLDLDASLNPSAWAALTDEYVANEEVDDYGRPIRRYVAVTTDQGKVKKKDKSKSGTKKSRKRGDVGRDGYSPQVRLAIMSACAHGLIEVICMPLTAACPAVRGSVSIRFVPHGFLPERSALGRRRRGRRDPDCQTRPRPSFPHA